MRKENTHFAVEPAPVGLELDISNQPLDHIMRVMQYDIVQGLQ